jgi:hypothetical protein
MPMYSTISDLHTYPPSCKVMCGVDLSQFGSKTETETQTLELNAQFRFGFGRLVEPNCAFGSAFAKSTRFTELFPFKEGVQSN